MRLIDADKFKEELDTFGMAMSEFSNIDIIEMIDNAPTVEERQHGHWEEDEDKDIYCTQCKHFLYPAEIRLQPITLSCRRLKRKFCPECGAIMDEVNEDEKI